MFDDWHWNRRLDSPSISNEIQLALREHSPREFFDELKGQMEFNMALPIDERRRYELASRWYWLADAEPDSVNQFIQFWIVIESLLMSDHGNITSVKTRTAALLTHLNPLLRTIPRIVSSPLALASSVESVHAS